MLTARLLGGVAFGHFIVLITSASTLSQIALFGAHRAAIRASAQTADEDRSGHATLHRDASAVCRYVIPPLSIVGGFLEYIISGDGSVWTAVAFASISILGAQQTLWISYLRGLGRPQMSSLLGGGQGGAVGLMLQLGAFTLLYIRQVPTSVESAMGVVIASYAVVALASWLMVKAIWGRLVLRPGTRHALGVLRNCWRFAGIQVAGYASTGLEIWLAATFLSARATSDFSAAQRVIVALAVPLSAAQLVIAPVVARLFHRQEHELLQRVLRASASATALITAILAVPILLEPAIIVHFTVGDVFRGAVPLILILALGQIANVASGTCGPALTMTGHEGLVARILWSGLAARTIIGIPTSLEYGVVGLAISASVITAAVWAYTALMTVRVLGIRTYPSLRPDLGLLRSTSI